MDELHNNNNGLDNTDDDIVITNYENYINNQADNNDNNNDNNDDDIEIEGAAQDEKIDVKVTQAAAPANSEIYTYNGHEAKSSGDDEILSDDIIRNINIINNQINNQIDNVIDNNENVIEDDDIVIEGADKGEKIDVKAVGKEDDVQIAGEPVEQDIPDATSEQIWQGYYSYLKMYGFFHTKDGNDANNTIEDEAKRWAADEFDREDIKFDKDVTAYSAMLSQHDLIYDNILPDNELYRRVPDFCPVVYTKNDRVVVISTDSHGYITNKEPQAIYNYSMTVLKKILSDKAAHARSTWSDIKVSVGMSSSPFKKIEPALTDLYNLGNLNYDSDTAEYSRKLTAVIDACQAYIDYKQQDKKEADYNDSDKARLGYAKDVIRFMKMKQNDLELVQKAVATLNKYSTNEAHPEELADTIAREDAQILERKTAEAKQKERDAQRNDPYKALRNQYTRYKNMPETLDGMFKDALRDTEQALYTNAPDNVAADAVAQLLGTMIAANLITNNRNNTAHSGFMESFFYEALYDLRDKKSTVFKDTIHQLGINAIINSGNFKLQNGNPVVSKDDLTNILKNVDVRKLTENADVVFTDNIFPISSIARNKYTDNHTEKNEDMMLQFIAEEYIIEPMQEKEADKNLSKLSLDDGIKLMSECIFCSILKSELDSKDFDKVLADDTSLTHQLNNVNRYRDLAGVREEHDRIIDRIKDMPEPIQMLLDKADKDGNISLKDIKGLINDNYPDKFAATYADYIALKDDPSLKVAATFDEAYRRKTGVPAIVEEIFDTCRKNLYDGLHAPKKDIKSLNINAAYILGSMVASDLIRRENLSTYSDVLDRGVINYKYLSVYNHQDKDSESYKKSVSYVKEDILKMGMAALKVGSLMTKQYHDDKVGILNFDNPLLSADAITKIMDNFNTVNVTHNLERLGNIDKIYNERSFAHTMESYAYHAKLQDKHKFDNVNSWLYKFATKGIVEPLERLEAKAKESGKKLDDMVIKKKDAQKLYAELVFSNALLDEMNDNKHMALENMKHPVITKLTKVFNAEGEQGLEKAHDKFIDELLNYSLAFDKHIHEPNDLNINVDKDISVKNFKRLVDHNKALSFAQSAGINDIDFTSKGVDINGVNYHDYKDALLVNGQLTVNNLLANSNDSIICYRYGQNLMESFKKHCDDLFPRMYNDVFKLSRGPVARAAAKDIFASITAMTLINYDQKLIAKGEKPAFSSIAGKLDPQVIKKTILSTDAAKEYFKGADNICMIAFVSDEALRNDLAKKIQPQFAMNIQKVLQDMKSGVKTTDNKNINNKTNDKTSDKTNDNAKSNASNQVKTTGNSKH